MIELNPLKRYSTTDALKHRFISYLLVNEPGLPNAYFDETKVVPQLDDNVLCLVKDYTEKIEDFIDHKLLKERRFAQKTRLIQKDIEREDRKRMIEQKKQFRRKFMTPGKDFDDEEDDEDDEEKSKAGENEVDIKADLENSRLDEPGNSELYLSKQ